ncbi:copper chaperone [bacterium]|nr:copper chaperone [bacterium]
MKGILMRISLKIFFRSFVVVGGVMSTIAMADSIKVSVNGMVCGFCVQGITKKLNGTDAVENVKVDLDKKLVSFSIPAGKKLDDETIKKLITESGYTVVKLEREKQ